MRAEETAEDRRPGRYNRSRSYLWNLIHLSAAKERAMTGATWDVRTTKAEVVDDANAGKGCLGRAAEDEPVFVLRAKDINAVRTIEAWCDWATLEGVPLHKIQQARQVQQLMVQWRRSNLVKAPD